MKNGLLVLAALALGCAKTPASAPVTSPVAPPVASRAAAKPNPDGSLEMAFGIPDAEDWREVDKYTSGFSSWTPDMVIRNDKLDAIIAFSGVPRVLGSPFELAVSFSRTYDGHSPVVMGDANGRSASFSRCAKTKNDIVMCGKTYVVDIEGNAQGNVVLLGRWPERSNDVATRDIDEAARTLHAKPAK